MLYTGLFLLALASLCHLHSFSPIPTVGEEEKPEITDEVKELENLRTDNNKVNSTEVSHQEAHHEETEPLPTPLPEIEEPQPNSRSAIFRHRGITQAKKSYWSETIQEPTDSYAKFAGIQYSPTDLAAYVFNTGDEEGVAVAVEELVREGMMGRTDAINYLQDMKQILTYLRDQYEQQKLEEFKARAYSKPHVIQPIPSLPREEFISPLDTDKRESINVEVTTEHPHQVMVASTLQSKGVSTTIRPKMVESHTEKDNTKVYYKDDDYKRRVPPRNSNAFAFEIIYKLAKDMFSQSLVRDDPIAEETLSGLVSYLESEVGNNRISPAMKEKVLEVISTALVDSMRESYMNDNLANQTPSLEESNLYQRLLESGGESSVSKVPMSEVYRKLALEGHDDMLQLASTSSRPKSS